jgi:hypothetical protein
MIEYSFFIIEENRVNFFYLYFRHKLRQFVSLTLFLISSNFYFEVQINFQLLIRELIFFNFAYFYFMLFILFYSL